MFRLVDELRNLEARITEDELDMLDWRDLSDTWAMVC